MGDLERFFVRDFISSFAGRTTLAATLTLAPLLALAAPTPWQKLAPTLFEHLVPAERGFPNPITMSIAQDGDGFIWFATQSGLGRWDGYRMRNFFFSADDARSLPGDFVQTLHVDRRGRLWLGTTTGGVAMYDKQTESFVRYPAGANGLSSPAIAALASDANGIWIGTAAGLDYIDLAHGGLIRHYPRDASAAGGARANQIRALATDSTGALWIGSNAGLARRDAASGAIEDLPFANGPADAVLSLGASHAGAVVFGTLKSGIGMARPADGARLLAIDQVPDANSAMVLSLTETQPGTWWAATYGGGVIEFDISGHGRRIVHRPAMPISLSHDRVAAIWRDRSGLVWVANERGVDIHNPANHSVDTILDGVGLPEISAFAFMSDSAGRLWVALGDQGVDLIAPDGRRSAGLRPDPARPDSALPNRLILSMVEAEPQEAWIGTAMGLYHTSGKGSRVSRVALPQADPYPRIGAMLRQGELLWLGVPAGLLRYDLRSRSAQLYGQGPAGSGGLTDNRVTSLRADPDGALWVGTRNGLNRFDPATGRAEQILPGAGADTLPHSVIGTMAFDAQGRLWAGSLNKGIGIFEGRHPDGTPRFRRLDLGNGLPSNSITALQLGAGGRMWASTADGIAAIDSRTLQVQVLDRTAGLVFQPYIVGAVGKTAQSDIVFGTSGGYVVVRPELPQPWRYQPPLVVSSIRLDRDSVAPAPLLVSGARPLAIPPGTRKVEIEVAALDYSASARNRYAFKLEGYDKDWVEADATRRAANYANVPPGTYKLSMRGSNRDGAWSPHELSMELHFLPAWYQTWWARTGGALAVLAAAFGFYRWRVRNLQQQVYSRTLHLERVHAIVKAINDELDFDALLHTILRESSAIGEVGVAYALICEAPGGPLAIRASWGHDALPSARAGMSLAAAQAQFVDAAVVIEPDMFLKQRTMLAIRICVDQQLQQAQGYLVFKQGTPFARKDIEMFQALKEPFVSAFQKASAISVIQRARAEAEASTRAKSEFLANISHEIRTPMNAILGFAGLGTHLDLPPKPRDYFTKIGRAGQNLLSIIDDVLDFAKIESGKLELEAVPFDLGDTLAQLADMFSWQAAEKSLELLAWAAPDVPLRLVGDPLRLNQVLVNLVGNALKFTARGHIGLRVELVEAVPDHPLRLRFIVEDTGVGISAEQQARLFRAFSQADTSTTRLYGGTGLGLAISQQLVQAMGGVIAIESQPGSGSRFHFELALQHQPGPQAAPAPLAAEAAGKRILVVNNNAMLRDMLERQLRHHGFAVHLVNSGAAALDYLARQPADLVLLDWDLPLMSGAETARRIHADAAHASLPVVLMMTEFAREPASQAAAKAGIAATLIKPLHPQQLLEAVLVGLGLTLPPRRAGVLPTALSDAARRIAGARVLVVDDNVINQQVAREVLLRAGVLVELAGSGAEAVLMVDQQPFDAVLMDIQMPGMDGYEAAARIRSKPQHAQLPLIAMTAHAVAGFRESSLGMGMNDYVTKPIDPDRLFAVLANQISRAAGPARAVLAPELAATLAASAGEASAVPGIDMAQVLARLGGNRQLLSALLDRFLLDFADAPQRLLAAMDAGADQAALLVHKVRGAAGNLSMQELHRTAGELEPLLLSPRRTQCTDALAAFSAALERVLDGLQALDGSAPAAGAVQPLGKEMPLP
jgi:signal transduction histidine kinase/CheY-like chemotaxis protein/ligand-binding sensor domain-containing protein